MRLTFLGAVAVLVSACATQTPESRPASTDAPTVPIAEVPVSETAPLPATVPSAGTPVLVELTEPSFPWAPPDVSCSGGSYTHVLAGRGVFHSALGAHERYMVLEYDYDTFRDDGSTYVAFLVKEQPDADTRWECKPVTSNVLTLSGRGSGVHLYFVFDERGLPYSYVPKSFGVLRGFTFYPSEKRRLDEQVSARAPAS